MTTTRAGSSSNKEVYLQPSATQQTIEEVLIVLSGVHQGIPEWIDPNQPLHLLPAPPEPADAAPNPSPGQSANLQTEADRLLEKYRRRMAPLQPASSPAGNPAEQQTQPPAGPAETPRSKPPQAPPAGR